MLCEYSFATYYSQNCPLLTTLSFFLTPKIRYSYFASSYCSSTLQTALQWNEWILGFFYIIFIYEKFCKEIQASFWLLRKLKRRNMKCSFLSKDIVRNSIKILWSTESITFLIIHSTANYYYVRNWLLEHCFSFWKNCCVYFFVCAVCVSRMLHEYKEFEQKDFSCN